MVNNEETKLEDDEISLIDLFAVLWEYKMMIVVITLIAMIGVVMVSIISLKLPPNKSFLPNQYTTSAQILIDDATSSGSLSKQLSGSGLGNLAGMVGVDLSNLDKQGGGGRSICNISSP